MRHGLLVLALAVGACSTPAQAPLPSETADPGAVAALIADSTDGTSPQAAFDLTLLYYGAIAEHDYRTAFELWGPDGPPGQTFDQFRDGFAETASVTAIVDEPSEPEGAAGSTYVTVPVHITAMTTGGAEQRFEGTYTLRRVNDVPGAEPWQLRWHIASADLAGV